MQLPIRFQVQPLSIATIALSLTAMPPSALSMMLMVPVKGLSFFAFPLERGHYCPPT
ncbi:MAG: hypothetical protein Q3X77_06610 [Oscillospiraceae bacterium]|nr:hypothetical protein [Oscillospiraceae bacterium]